MYGYFYKVLWTIKSLLPATARFTEDGTVRVTEDNQYRIIE